MLLLDIVWFCNQNALWGQFKPARGVSVNADLKGIVWDDQMKILKQIKKSCDPQGTTLHRVVCHLLVLLLVEQQVSRNQLA